MEIFMILIPTMLNVVITSGSLNTCSGQWASLKMWVYFQFSYIFSQLITFKKDHSFKGSTINDLGAEENSEMNLFFPRDSLSKFLFVREAFSWRKTIHWRGRPLMIWGGGAEEN